MKNKPTKTKKTPLKMKVRKLRTSVRAGKGIKMGTASVLVLAFLVE